MNNRINIAEILKNCPKRMKLYSPLFGTVIFNRIIDTDSEYIISVDDIEGSTQDFTRNGYFYENFLDAECILFPSKDMRDWSKLLWKKGDVLVSKDGKKECIFSNFIGDNFTAFIGRHYLNCSDENNIEYEDDGVYSTEDFSLEVEDVAKCYINTIQERLGGKLNPENLEIESVKPKYELKPFDRVLVRDSENRNWKADIFSHFSCNNEYPYQCVSMTYRECIPYEGNEHYLGTNKDYK